jgi:hypothetical protein
VANIGGQLDGQVQSLDPDTPVRGDAGVTQVQQRIAPEPQD